jgi:NADH-quinone oxidoreductase subunit N
MYIIAALISQRARSPNGSLIFIAAIPACCFCEESAKTNFLLHNVPLLKIMLLLGGSVISRLMKNDSFENRLLMTCSILGSLLVVSANNFILLFFSMQLMMIPACRLIGRDDPNFRRNFFLSCILRSLLLAAAIGFIYFSLKVTSFGDIRYLISFSEIGQNSLLLSILILASLPLRFGFSPENSFAFRIIREKISNAALIYCVAYPAALIVFYRITANVFGNFGGRNLLLSAGLILSASAAVQLPFQNNLRKIIACAVTSHVGTIFICCAFPCYNSANAVIFSTASEMISLLGIFVLLDEVKKNKYSEIENIQHLNSLQNRHPIFALSIFALFLLLFGFPPFLGFQSRFYLFSAMVENFSMLMIYAATLIPNLICIIKISEALWFKKNNDIFIFDEVTGKITGFLASLTIIAIPIIFMMLQTINNYMYFT